MARILISPSKYVQGAGEMKNIHTAAGMPGGNEKIQGT